MDVAGNSALFKAVAEALRFAVKGVCGVDPLGGEPGPWRSCFMGAVHAL
jgi:hypothetical protein